MRLMILIAALTASSLATAQPSAEVVQAFVASRADEPGPGRLDALEALLDSPHVSSLPRLLSALEANGGRVVALEKVMSKVERRRDKAAGTVLKYEGRRGSQWDKAVEELERLDNDLRFRRRQIRDLFKECRALREGYRKCYDRGTPEEREQHMKGLLRRASGRAAYPVRRQLMKLLAQISDPRAADVLGRILSTDRDPFARSAAADALGDQGLIESESLLVAALSDDYAVVRAAAVSSLRVLGAAEAVTGLIERLPNETGRLLQDVITTLRHLTGVTYHENVVLWREWWAKEKPRYRRAGKRGKTMDRTLRKRDLLADGNGSGFYGLRFRSHALVYVIDTSGSMAERAKRAGTTGPGGEDETKLDRAKRELIKSLKSLPSGIDVNVIAYSTGLNAYANDMVKLTDGERRSMIAWARALRADGKTNIFDALALVFDEARGKRGRPSKAMIVDTILLLTDGLPTAGRVQDSDLIASEVERMNDRARIVIHTIGVGPDHDVTLLKELSKASQGLYLRAR